MFNVGLFCPTAQRKNCLNQIFGFNSASTNRDIILHTNLQIKIKGKIKYYDWMPQEKYERLLKEMDLVLSVFLAESFCYSFLEAMSNGIPSLCSPCIADNFSLPQDLRDSLVIHNCDSASEIAQKIISLVDLDLISYNRLREECKFHISKFIKGNNSKLKEILEKT